MEAAETLYQLIPNIKKDYTRISPMSSEMKYLVQILMVATDPPISSTRSLLMKKQPRLLSKAKFSLPEITLKIVEGQVK